MLKQGCFGIVAQRLTRRIRVRTLHAILHQARIDLILFFWFHWYLFFDIKIRKIFSQSGS